MGQRTGNLDSMGRIIARELRQTHLLCMTGGCQNRALKGEQFCNQHIDQKAHP